MCVLSSFIHNVSHNPPGAKVMSYGGKGNKSKWHLVILLAQLGGFFCVSLPPGTPFASKPPCFPADIAASLKLLFFCLRTQSQVEGQGFESWRALLGGSGQSFPDLWVCVEWVATVMLRFFWGFFVVGVFFLPHHLTASSWKTRQSCWLPCNGLFSCWVEQYCCHMLKATISPGRYMSKAAAIPFPLWQM